MHKLGSSLSLFPSCFGMDDVRLTFLQDIFEAVSSASILPPENARPPGFLCRQPCQLSKLVNLLCRSIFFRPPPLPSLLCGRGNQPDRKHWQNKKVAFGRSLSRSGMIYGLVPPLEGEKNKRETEPNTPNIPFTTQVGRQPRRQRCSRRDRPPSLPLSLSHVLQKVTPTEKRPRKNVPREQRRRRRRRRRRRSRKRRTC